MIKDSSVANRGQIPFISLVPFLLIAFGLAWGILALFIFLPDQMTGIFGELTGQHPLFFLAVYAPAIAAFIVVTYKAGAGGLRRYLSRLLLWRCSLSWYAFLIIGIPLLFFWWICVEGKSFRGTVFVYLISVTYCGFAINCDQRPGRGVRMARVGSAYTATEVSAHLGGTDSWCHLGLLALACIPVEWDATKRLVIHPVFCRLYCVKCNRNTLI